MKWNFSDNKDSDESEESEDIEDDKNWLINDIFSYANNYNAIKNTYPYFALHQLAWRVSSVKLGLKSHRLA